MKHKSIILLSGGLDSLVCLGLYRQKYNVELALTFDYGQKAAKNEIRAAKNLCDYYKVKTHEVITLGWLREITNNSLTTSEDLPKGAIGTKLSTDAVWVPNRNGLFLNIAASYADSYGYTDIIIGANKEEGETFPDNTINFIERIDSEFEYSTLVKPKVFAPLINYDKNDIVKLALENSMPLDFVFSCYDSNAGHCGECESCLRLKRALEANKDTHYKDILFKI